MYYHSLKVCWSKNIKRIRISRANKWDRDPRFRNVMNVYVEVSRPYVIRKHGKNRWNRPTFRLQKEIFPVSSFRPFSTGWMSYTVSLQCSFHRDDTRSRTFRGYKINLACKTEMEAWKRNRNRWRKGRGSR